eukprot:5375159-Pleurochrysis_carterae.AAC.1
MDRFAAGSELARADDLTSRHRPVGVSTDPVRWRVGFLEIWIRVRRIRGSVAPIILIIPRTIGKTIEVVRAADRREKNA